MAIYKGYNTVGVTFGTTKLEDEEIIKRDLLNHFNIRKGEKLMNPTFGSAVWDHLYSPMTEDVKQLLVDDVTEIVNSDPRTSVTDITLSEYELGIQIEVGLIYNETNQSEQLVFEFNSETNTVRAASV